MAKRHEVFPTRFLTAADLNGKAITLTIDRAPIETLKNKNGEDTKTVLYFRGTKKSLPLNRTNWDSCAGICGDDSDDWPGHKIQMYPTTTQFGADIVDCIRIKEPEQVELPIKKKKEKQQAETASLAEDMDDQIPF